MVDKAGSSENQNNNDSIRQEVEQNIRTASSVDSRSEADSEELEDLETELGMKEVYLDEAELDSIPTDEIDNELDSDDDGIEDNSEAEEPEIVDNRPQELTESRGTGLQGRPLDRTGSFSRRESHLLNEPDYTLTGGDVDANYEDADAVGEESVGGTVATPDQDIVEDLATAVGVELDDRSYLRVGEMLEQRDDRRWELEPSSSEDYQERQQEE
jgi:hypothetical protein